MSEQIETICRHCIFAEWDDVRRQEGCFPGILEKYRQQGAKIRNPIDKDSYKYFTLPGRVCMYCRQQKWADEKEVASLLDAVDKVRKEVELRCTAIVYVGRDETLDDALKTAKALEANTALQPTRMLFIINNDIKPNQFVSWAHYQLHLPWQFELVLEPDVGVKRCLDLAVKKVDDMWFAFFRAGFEPPDDFFWCIDHYLNDELGRFLVLLPEEESGLVLQRVAHKIFGGNIGEHDIVEKIQILAKEQECQNLVIPASQIIPKMIVTQ